MTNKELQTLREMLTTAKMTNASFGFSTDSVIVEKLGTPIFKQNLDEFIKDEVRIYMNSWLVEPLQELIDIEEKRRNIVR